MAERRGMGELESEVMAHLWVAEVPLTPAEVRDALGTDLAYTTVMTILVRLWEKGLVHRQRRGRAFAYWPSVSEAELAAKRMQATLARTGDPEKALARFVDTLSARDERILRRIVSQPARDR